MIKTDPPPQASPQADFPRGSVICPVTDKGAWACEVPAAALDLSVRVEGFVPHYVWGVVVQAGKSLSLGTIALKRGASVVGRVEVEEGTLAAEKAVARLGPLAAPGGDLRTVARLKRSIFESKVDKRGFFQLGGIPAGSYLLEVEHPGFAPGRVYPLDVWPGSETSLQQAVVLRRPLTLEIVVSPAADWLGKPWQAQVQRAADFSDNYVGEPRHEGPVDSTGRLVVPGQTPGNFKVKILDSLGNRLHDELFRLEGPPDARREIQLKLIAVRGRLSLGGEPLAATLHFGGVTGAVRSVMEADEEGRFDGIVPKDGPWTVDVRALEPSLETQAVVEVRADRHGRAAVVLDLPDTQVFGKVIDEEGQGVAKATVFLGTGETILSVSSREDGTFEARAFPEGHHILSAEHFAAEGRSTSEGTLVSLTDGQPAGPVELRLHKVKAVKGTVQSPRGPVPGAQILLFARRPPLPSGSAGRTGMDGNFSADLPGRTDTAVAIVSPPGNALKAFEFPADGSSLILNVPAEGGSLEVVLPYSVEEIAGLRLMPLVFQNGIPLPGANLITWARGHGEAFSTPGGFRVPNLASGDYRVCMTPKEVRPDWETVALLDWQGLKDCASGFLDAEGTLKLVVPRGQRGAH